jgi:hypothetical protein
LGLRKLARKSHGKSEHDERDPGARPVLEHSAAEISSDQLIGLVEKRPLERLCRGNRSD